jgi:molybdopterin/thiamine biosynthesis adenylyltransferase
MIPELRMLEEHADALKRLLFVDDNESAALAICGRSKSIDPWTGKSVERFIVREVVPVPTEAYFERHADSFTWSTTPFYNVLKRVERKNLAVVVFHSHPRDCLRFSPADDVADQELFEIAFNRLDSEDRHMSAIMDPDGNFLARAYGPDLVATMADRISIIGRQWQFRSDKAHEILPELDRQLRAFGASSFQAFANLRVAIVGCGGTGSAVAMLLARIGIRNFVLIDKDYVDKTNVNRMHFSSRDAAAKQRQKVDVVKEGMMATGLPMDIVTIAEKVSDPRALAALQGCDLVFGCTDDHMGREVLNRMAHFYYIPVIDLGLLIEPNEAGGYDTFDGRVTVVQPGYTCQTCRGLIDPEAMHIEAIKGDANILGERKRAGYVPNDADPNPVVVTFTTEVATMAVNEMFHRLIAFRGRDNHCSERIRQFQELKDSDILSAGKPRSGCKLCDRRAYDGRGDMIPFLDMVL